MKCTLYFPGEEGVSLSFFGMFPETVVSGRAVSEILEFDECISIWIRP
jgi:hypothetical protein